MPFKRKKLLAAFALLVLALGAGELFARFYLGLGTPPLYIAHPRIEYLLKPDQDVRRFGNHFVVNRYGMRSADFPPHKARPELRVMVFGDSVINGGNLTDQAELATQIVANRLAPDRPAVVGNISAGSWGPGNWLAYAREYGFFEADVVVLAISSHDYGDNPTFADLQPDTHPTRQPVSALAEGLMRYLPRYVPSLRHAEDPLQGGGSAPAVPAGAVEQARADLSAFLVLAQQHARKLIVLQHLERIEITSREPKPGHAAIHSLCAELGVETVSLEPYFRRALAQGIEPYRDNIHPNAAGQRLIAAAIIANLPPSGG